jgi:hypothetical protein
VSPFYLKNDAHEKTYQTYYDAKFFGIDMPDDIAMTVQDRAGHTLDFMIQSWPLYADAYLFMADIHERQDRKAEAIEMLNNALSTKGMAARDRFRLSAKLRDLEGTN